jgi:hypothetical protein
MEKKSAHLVGLLAPFPCTSRVLKHPKCWMSGKLDSDFVACADVGERNMPSPLHVLGSVGDQLFRLNFLLHPLTA